MSKSITFNTMNKLMTVEFYNEYKTRIIEELKFTNKLFPIYAFYEKNSDLLLKFEDYSFDISKCNIESGEIYYLKGLMYHCVNEEDLQSLNSENIAYFVNNSNNDLKEVSIKNNKSCENFIKAFDCFNTNNTEDFCYYFIIAAYMNLKSYSFNYKFSFIENSKFKIVQYSKNIDNSLNEFSEIMKMHNKQTSIIKKDEKNHFKNSINYYCLNEKNYVLIQDNMIKSGSLTNLIKLSLIKNSSKEKIVILSKENDKLDQIVIHDEINNIFNAEFYFKILCLHEINNVNLKNIFDIKQIAENSVDLNINLMKWRMNENIKNEKIKSAKILIFGAGTLGCHVSRGLIGWGVRNITFVDNGKVSYSNPVRQSLYTYEDSINSLYKAEVAAINIKQIFPSINAQGIVLSIPHPGVSLINEHAEKTFLEECAKIENLIKEHDYVFLLTDSRESRWLPTMLSSYYNKPCISSALGFDSYCIIRHGMKNTNPKLACYFCSDIVSPIDTSKNRTLDQQCTISRPGISLICSGFAVETMINIISDSFENTPQCIRGNIHDWSLNNIQNHAFSK